MLFSYPILVLKTKLLIAKFSRNSFLRQLQNLQNLWTVEKLQKSPPSACAARLSATTIQSDLTGWLLEATIVALRYDFKNFKYVFLNGTSFP